jgi:hypothetical protein
MTDQRPAPYPADTRAKGWRFELDYERIDESDTWALAAEIPMAQHALLMMWLVAWRQEPCGSLPNDEGVIRARCKIPLSAWPKLRDILMRNWWAADDGRLYHDTITKRVLAMLEKRAKDAKRASDRRARLADPHEDQPELTDASRVTQGGHASDSSASSTPSTKHRKKRSTPPPPADAGGAFERFWSTWPAHKRKVAKDQCRAKWKTRGCDDIAEKVIAGLQAAITSEDWTKDGGEFIPSPLVWLNQKRWEALTADEVRAANWQDTRSGIEAKGAELGVGTWDRAAWETGAGGIDWATYATRVFKAAGITLRAAA